ncbi:MAG: heat shock protein HslJ [Cyclobacteriaceae bacterium]|jgi:heat shock protein HslJ
MKTCEFFSSLIFLLFLNCGSENEQPQPWLGSWIISSFSNNEVKYEQIDSLNMSITFLNNKEGELYGACNGGSVSFSINSNKGTLLFTKVSLTERACQDNSLNWTEEDLATILYTINHWSIKSDSLFFDGEGDSEVTLHR